MKKVCVNSHAAYLLKGVIQRIILIDKVLAKAERCEKVRKIEFSKNYGFICLQSVALHEKKLLAIYHP
jgi:hypothetical protein